jgi:hypothetical protein
MRQVRIVELLARRVAYTLMNAYDPSTGLLTRPAFEKRAHALLTPEALSGNTSVYLHRPRSPAPAQRETRDARRRRGHRASGETIRRNLSPRMLASRISGDGLPCSCPMRAGSGPGHRRRAARIAVQPRF